MRIYELQNRTEQLMTALLNIWENSVRETHTFLSDAEITKIKEYVPQALTDISHLVIAANDSGEPTAFMGIEGSRLEMLFFSPEERGKGIGKQLVQWGISGYAINEVTVNEQNTQAVGFYEHIGFRTYKRTACDELGNPYPLLYMKNIP